MTSDDPFVDFHGARPLRSLLGLLRPYRLKVGVALVLFVLKDLPVWLMPVFTAALIDVVVDDGTVPSAVWIAVGAAAVLLSNYPTSMGFVRLASAVFRDLAARLRIAIAATLQQLSIGYHARTSSSVIQSKLVRDVENIELLLGAAVPTLLSGIGLLVGALIVTAIQVPQFVLVFAVTIPLSSLIVIGVRKVSRRQNEGFRRAIEALSSTVGEMASLMPITRAHGLESESQRRIQERAQDVRESGIKLDRINGRFAVVSWISYQLLGLACLVLAALASLLDVLPITPGQVVLLSSYFALLTSAIVQILGLLPIVSKGIESGRSLGDIFGEEDREDNDGKLDVERVDGRFSFENVSFRYPDASHSAVEAVDLAVAAGESIALVGASGSGKSTMLNLVLGFVRPTSGRVTLDGLDFSSIDLRTYRQHIAIVPQEPVLFDGSVRDNVAYGLGEVDDAVVARALVDANAAEFVEALPEGWHTRVGDRGSSLSGGQRQRLAIARALIRDPRVLVFDEATSALDARTEHQVNEALQRVMIGRTTFIVAHRLSTVQSADQIVVLDGGRIVETGTHDELLSRDGHYRHLFVQGTY